MSFLPQMITGERAPMHRCLKHESKPSRNGIAIKHRWYRKRFKGLLLVMFLCLAMCSSAWSAGKVHVDPSRQTVRATPSIATKGTKTTLGPVKIGGPKDKYKAIYLTAWFEKTVGGSGVPDFVRFDLLSVVKRRSLDVDLYVQLIADGRKLAPGSNRWAVKNIERDPRVIGERMEMKMSIEEFRSIANAKNLTVKYDAIPFEVSDQVLAGLRELAKQIPSPQ